MRADGQKRKLHMQQVRQRKNGNRRKFEMLDVNWARPDRVKSSGAAQTLDMLALDVIREGYADSKADSVNDIR